MKRVLILHISEVGGHSKAAENIKEAINFLSSDIEVITLNSFGYFYPNTEKIVDFLYTNTIKYLPFLWGVLYDKKPLVKNTSFFLKYINILTFKKLSLLIKKFSFNCVIATQAYPCRLVCDFKKLKGINIPVVAVITDYYPHRFWVHPYVDKYVVASEEAKDVLIKEGIQKDKIEIFGIPLSIKFINSFPKENIKEEFGFSLDLPTILIMGGGLGLGPIERIVLELNKLERDFQIIVICGKNKNLFNWLKKYANKFRKKIFYFGYVDFVNKIMDFADIIITKAGGITISEALAKGLAIIVTFPIPGQEERNVDFLLKRNAILRIDNLSKIPFYVDNLLSNRKNLDSLKQSAKKIAFADSSLRIANLVLKTLI